AGFSNFALARASQAEVNSLVQNQEAARRNVIENIQVQYQQFVSAKDRETSLVAAVAGAQIVVSSYRRQFIAGRKSWLEVLNAVRE
ncbi:TolC family protein, partial [Pseudoalteromonas sp. SIMBA_153]